MNKTALLERIMKSEAKKMIETQDKLAKVVSFTDELEKNGANLSDYPEMWGDVVNILEDVIDEANASIEAIKLSKELLDE